MKESSVLIGQELTVSFSGGRFRKGVRVPIGVLGGGVWGRVQVGGGGRGMGFPVENEEKTGRVWGRWRLGWGQPKKPARQCARVCQNYLVAKYPGVSVIPE